MKKINYIVECNACKKANILVNRKMLAELAVNDKEAFDVVFETAKAAK